MHQEHEKEERENQHAKAEVNRLKGIVSGTNAAKPNYPVPIPSKAWSSTAVPQPSTTDRKKQMAQLAEMGISVPDEYRAELALAGEWQTIGQAPVSHAEQSLTESLSTGVRKRKLEDEDETTEGQSEANRGWGSTAKTYPAAAQMLDADLDILLAGGILPKNDAQLSGATTSDSSGDQNTTACTLDKAVEDKERARTLIDALDAAEGKNSALLSTPTEPDVVFKKRKPKIAKHS